VKSEVPLNDQPQFIHHSSAAPDQPKKNSV
jgi:hypothetical protein